MKQADAGEKPSHRPSVKPEASEKPQAASAAICALISLSAGAGTMPSHARTKRDGPALFRAGMRHFEGRSQAKKSYVLPTPNSTISGALTRGGSKNEVGVQGCVLNAAAAQPAS